MSPEIQGLTEFEVGNILVTEETLPGGGIRIHEEGRTLGVDLEIIGSKFAYKTHSWDEIKMKLAKDTVEGIVSEAELTHNLSGLSKRIAEELSELD